MSIAKSEIIDCLGERAAALIRAHGLGPADDERLVRRLVELRHLAAAVSRELSPRQVAETVLDRALALLGATSGTISWAIAPDTLSMLYARNVPDDWATRFARFSAHAPFPAGEAFRTSEPVWLEREEDVAARFPGLVESWRGRGRPVWASIPLLLGGSPVGILGLAFPPDAHVDTLDRAFALALAQECANALDRARLHEEERAHRARAEETGALLDAFIANVPTGLAFFDRELRYVRVNPALAAMNGLPPEAHAGRKIGEVLSDPRWADGVRAAEALLRAAIESGTSTLDQASSTEQPPGSGRLRHFLLSTYPVRTASGTVLGAGASVRDVTALRASEALLDSIYDHAPIGLGLLDRSFRFVRLNHELAEMNGLPPEAHTGRTPRELLPALPLDAIEAGWRRILETGEPLLGFEVSGETPAAPGRIRYWIEDWYPVRVDGDVIGVAGVIREVTEQRRAEELQRLLVGIVGHDIRNPLGVVTTSARLLESTALDERQRQVVGRIRRAADSIGSLAQQLLDYTVIRAGKRVSIAARETEPGAVLREVLDEFRTLHPDRSVRAELSCGGAVVWDVARIRQLVGNLLSNAVKYGDAAAPIALECRPAGDDVVIEIRNRGAPIPPERLARIFDPLHQATEAERSAGGIGLGLFITREIAEAHGGGVEVRSDETATAFTVRLPRGAPAPAP